MSPLPVDGGHVVIRDPASFLAKKAKIASDGPSKLQARPGTCIFLWIREDKVAFICPQMHHLSDTLL